MDEFSVVKGGIELRDEKGVGWLVWIKWHNMKMRKICTSLNEVEKCKQYRRFYCLAVMSRQTKYTTFAQQLFLVSELP